MNDTENNTQVDEVSEEAESAVEEDSKSSSEATSPEADTLEASEAETSSAEQEEATESKADSTQDDSKEVAEKAPEETPSSSDKPAEAVEAKADKAENSEEADDDTPAPALKPLPEAQAKLPWYVVHTYSGYEHMVKASLEERIKIKGHQEKFGNILIPQETVVELVRGEKKTSTRKFLPGYIVVQVALTDETWHFVCETPKVTGFVGDSTSPMPLLPSEVENLVKQIEGSGKKSKPKVSFEEGDAVKVVDGPFAEFNGTVDDVKPDKGKLRVLISIFGRNTPVELDFLQVEKA